MYYLYYFLIKYDAVSQLFAWMIVNDINRNKNLHLCCQLSALVIPKKENNLA